VLAFDKDGGARDGAASVLVSTIQAKGALPALLRAIKTESEWRVLNAIFKGLGQSSLLPKLNETLLIPVADFLQR
jgi:hypothetical protein